MFVSNELDLGLEPTFKITNVSSVPQRSIFRYPGGKTWFVPYFRQWVNSLGYQPALLVEPFVGGGIISLTAAFEKLADKVLMSELDSNVAAVWRTVLGDDVQNFAAKILSFDLTYDNLNSVLSTKYLSDFDIAFQTILRNRTSHGGIIAPGSGVLKKGENGKGIKSRWYPTTLHRRLKDISQVSSLIEFKEADAFDILVQEKNNPQAVFFVDPPYTVGGKKAGSRLYIHNKIDHNYLFQLCSEVAGKVLMTYDNNEEVKQLSNKYGFFFKEISMRNKNNAKMTELVISKDLSWLI